VLGLVICWSADEPQRVGQVLVVPRRVPTSFSVFGRGEATPDDAHSRLYLATDRAGETRDAGALSAPKISRRQVLIRAQGAEHLEVQNVGRCGLFHNGQEAKDAYVLPGDTLQLGSQLLFLCVARTPWQHPFPAGYERHPFGLADQDGIVGESQAAWELRRQIASVAASEGHVLICGASGTGKELAAHAIHARSARGGKKLMSRSAATFPAGLIDAELFGNMANYPNAGMKERIGLIGAADGSTLFLDEFAELPLELQTHLLRVLDAGEYQRLGEVVLRRADFRFVAATNSPERLRQDVAARFRFTISIPDLNARREDIPLLTRHLLRKVPAQSDARPLRANAHASSGDNPTTSLRAMERLVRWQYVTHVRELEALLSALLTGISVDSITHSPPPAAAGRGPDSSDPAREPQVYADPQTISRGALQAALEEHNGVLERVWRSLGLKSRYALHRLMRKHNVRPRGS
jgi:two-component system nitrogen regulation response regulator GlnG/two-component system response regulator HydG